MRIGGDERPQRTERAGQGLHALAHELRLAPVRDPAESILEMYTALRPHRSSAEELEGWAGRLESAWEAPLTAAFVREASEVYAKRGLLAAERAPV